MVISGVDPLVGTRDIGAKPDAKLGFGDGLREDVFEGIPNLLRPVGTMPDLDSEELVRL